MAKAASGGDFEFTGTNLYGGLWTAQRSDLIPKDAATVLENVDLRLSEGAQGLKIRRGYHRGVTSPVAGQLRAAIYTTYGIVKRFYGAAGGPALFYADDGFSYPAAGASLVLPAGSMVIVAEPTFAQLKDKVVLTGFGLPVIIDIPTNAVSNITGFFAGADSVYPRACVTHQSRMWMCGTANATSAAATYYDSRVWFSAVGDASDFTSANNAGYIDIWATRPILAMASAGDTLFLFSQYQIHAIVGENPTNFQVYKVADIGTYHAQSVTSAHREVIFASPSGIYLIRRKGGIEKISTPIQNFWELNPTPGLSRLRLDPSTSQLWVSQIFDGVSVSTYIYNMTLGTWQRYIYKNSAGAVVSPLFFSDAAHNITPITAPPGKEGVAQVGEGVVLCGLDGSAHIFRMNVRGLTKDDGGTGSTITAKYRSAQVSVAEDILVSCDYAYGIWDTGGASPGSSLIHRIMHPNAVVIVADTYPATLGTNEQYLYRKTEVHQPLTRGILFESEWSDETIALTGFKVKGKIESVGVQ